MTKANLINELLNYHFQHHKNAYHTNEIEGSKELLKDAILTTNASGNFELNFHSEDLNKEALQIASKLLARDLPNDIVNAFEFLHEFEKTLKIKFGVSDYKPVYRALISGMKAYTLGKLDINGSNYAFLLTLDDNVAEHTKALEDFEEQYFRFLKSSNYSAEMIYGSCTHVLGKNKNNGHHVYKFLFALPANKPQLALEIYNYGLKNGILSYPGFAGNILCGLYDSGHTEAFQMANDLIKDNEVEAMRAMRGFTLQSSSEVEAVFAVVENVPAADVINAKQKSQVLCMIIENHNTSKETVEKCVLLILESLKSENHEIAHAVFEEMRYGIETHEYEKYVMLHAYLNNTMNFVVLDNFFYELKDSTYLFDLLVRNYESNGFRGKIDRFENQILHLWNENQQKVEEQILDLFRYKNLGLLAVKIMMSGNGYPIPVDVLKLDNESHQNNALERMCKYPHSIDKLLSTILKFRNSKFPAVRKNLQSLLEGMIFNTYHESLYKLIEKELDLPKEKKFLVPLKKALAAYEEMKLFKAVKELDPRENERNLMDLYYRLEHENHAKLMNDSKNSKSGLASMFKSVTVVRAKAWKIDGKDEVMPMGLIETSMMIDSNAYKNPISYEQNLEDF